MFRKVRSAVFSAVLVLGGAGTLVAQANYDTVQVRSLPVSKGVYMLQGAREHEGGHGEEIPSSLRALPCASW